jgi:hypothetical protein
MFMDGKCWEKYQGNMVSIKDKTARFKFHISKDDRFRVLVAYTVQDILKLYQEADLMVPPQQYSMFMFIDNNVMKKDMVDNRKMLNIRYSLGWHKILQQEIYN